MSAAISFYQLLTTISFTLLGLWFAVLALAHDGWRSDPARHRANGHIALHFVLPGMTGLGSVLAGGDPSVWRLVFLVGGLVGTVESVRYLRVSAGRWGTASRALRVLDPALYLLTAAAALLPRPVVGFVPLQVEGVATSAVFAAGMAYLWLTYTEPPRALAPTRDTAARPARTLDVGLSDHPV